jgi:hypothetical protein
MTHLVSNDYEIKQILDKSSVKTEGVSKEDLEALKKKLESQLGKEVFLKDEESGEQIRVLKTLNG